MTAEMPDKDTSAKKHRPTEHAGLRNASAFDPNATSRPTGSAATPSDLGDQTSVHTRRAYASDWKHFAAWCRREGLSPLPVDPQVVGSYIRACASGAGRTDGRPNSISTIERRLSSLSWNYARRGFALARQDQVITEALADARRGTGSSAPRKQALAPADLALMLETLDRGSLKGLRDRAILLLGFAGRLTRSEITGLDAGPDESDDARGWIAFGRRGLVVSLSGRTGQREVEIARQPNELSCAVAALEAWIRLGRITKGPVFRRVLRGGKTVGKARLHDQEVARLVKRAASAAGLRGNRAEAPTADPFSSRSLHVRGTSAGS